MIDGKVNLANSVYQLENGGLGTLLLMLTIAFLFTKSLPLITEWAVKREFFINLID